MKVYTWGFLGIETIIYIMFLTIDCIGVGSNSVSIYLKFAGIVLCVAVNFYYFVTRQAYNRWLCLAFLFLLLSDYHLLITNSYESGVLTFLFVQICFYCFMCSRESSHWGRKIMIRGIWTIVLDALIMFGLWIAGVDVDRTVVLASLYFLWFTANLWLSFYQWKASRETQIRLFSIGLILYFLCDLNVGIFNLGDYVAVAGSLFTMLYNFAAIAMWLFYLPGIVLITLSNHAALHEEKLHV